MRDRVGDELVELLGLDHAAGDQRRDALDRGEEDEADALGLAAFEGAVGLALSISSSMTEKARSAASCSAPDCSRCLPANISSSSAASRVAKRT